MVCRSCHNDLERMIPYRRMPMEFYTQVIKQFLQGGGYDYTAKPIRTG